MRLTDEQIAALAHPETGLAERAKRVLCAVARGEVFQLCDPRKRDEYQPSDMSEAQPVTTFAMALKGYKLIRLDRRVTEPAIAGGRPVRMWRITADGEAVLNRLGDHR